LISGISKKVIFFSFLFINFIQPSKSAELSKINKDPENTAWFFKLKIKDLSEMDTLMNKDDYDKFAKETSA